MQLLFEYFDLNSVFSAINLKSLLLYNLCRQLRIFFFMSIRVLLLFVKNFLSFSSSSFSPRCFSENEIKCLLWKDGRQFGQSYERSYRMHVRYGRCHRCETVRNSTIYNAILSYITVCKNWKVQNIRCLI